MADDWKLITDEMMTLYTYPCGVAAGEILRLKEDVVYRNSGGSATGEVRDAGSLAGILTGNADEPDVIWLRWEDGDVQTWDATILDSFERIQGGA